MKQAELKVFYLQSRKGLLAYVMGFIRIPGAAEELVQHAYLELISSLRKGKKINHPKAFIYKVARNAVLNQLKKESHAAQYKAWITQQSTGSMTGENNHKDEEKLTESVSKAIVELPPEQQEVLTLKLWQEMTFQAIADMTQVSLSTTQSRYEYAIRKLAAAFGTEEMV